MRLLAKSDVDKAKSIDRQREIDEGLKLARRVDALREVAAQEEATLATYRATTLSTIQGEIASETTKLNKLKGEVRTLEKRKADALAPLTVELEKIEAGRLELSNKEGELVAREAALYLDEVDIKEIVKILNKREEQTTYAQLDANQRLRDAGILKDEAERLQRLANDTLTTATASAEEILANAIQREEWVAARELAASAKEEELRTKEIDLAKEFSKLRDREATLERNIKRFTK